MTDARATKAEQMKQRCIETLEALFVEAQTQARAAHGRRHYAHEERMKTEAYALNQAVAALRKVQP